MRSETGGRPGWTRRELASFRWSAAALIVLAAHATAAWLAVNWHAAEAMPNDASLPLRASPVPAPPANIGGGATLTLTVPIRFSP